MTKRDWKNLDAKVAEEMLIDLITQPDIVKAEECGSRCLQLVYLKAEYRYENVPIPLVRKIPALVRKVHELSQVPF